MRYLLDTNILIRWLDPDTGSLSSEVLTIIESPNSVLLTSSFSIFEMRIKARIGKLQVAESIIEQLDKQSIIVLDYTESDSSHIDNHGIYWKDPFDLAIISQAINRKLPLITTDQNIIALNIPGLKVISAL
jgi:PIN domain nuclease of toxin-antitoxin system